jgi:UDP-N-acetylglucosamine transferase subunit ALG13
MKLQKEKLYIDLVPSSSWYNNLRDILKKEEWDIIRKKAYKVAGNKCRICGGKGKKHPVEAHERWSYDENTKIQKLERVVALCPMCHLSSHYGFAQIKGKEKLVRTHLMKINNWNEEYLDLHLEVAFEDYYRRSNYKWELDISIVPLLLNIEV